MNLDIRSNIYSNLKKESIEELKSTIEDAINSNDELVLPGLGVLFEIIWNDFDVTKKEELLLIIEKEINKD